MSTLNALAHVRCAVVDHKFSNPAEEPGPNPLYDIVDGLSWGQKGTFFTLLAKGMSDVDALAETIRYEVSA